MAVNAREVTNNIRQDITDKIVAALEKGNKPWQRPWAGGEVKNVASRRGYRGVNILLLAIHQMQYELSSNVYGTFRQWDERKCSVKKGSKGCPIVYFSPIVKKGKPEGDGEGEKDSKYMLLKTYTVFSSDQVQGGEKFATAPTLDFKPCDEADRIVRETKAVIKHGGDSAHYSPTSDHIHMPKTGVFKTSEGYYSTLLHELTHWTGHEKRLNRSLTGNKFSESYAFEELIAEIGGCYLMGHCGLPPQDLDNHVSYVSSWLKGLRGDNTAIMKAATQASKASDYVLDLAGIKNETCE